MKPDQGLILGGRYTLTERIAMGGMGEVWAAHDSALDRTVAVKVLREEFTGDKDFLRRLRAEARNSAALRHPNIAQMHDYGEQDGTGYLVMEMVRGESLADWLERQAIIPALDLLPIITDTARGLEHAHHSGVVHRDIKPGNILLQRASLNVRPTAAKITDFGVSIAVNQAPMTATGMVMGTAQYLSPEQAIGKQAMPQSDLYALGVIAYEATVGRRPFTGKSPVDIAVAHVNAPVPPLPDHVDPRMAALIMRLLDKDPARRPACAQDLADASQAVYDKLRAEAQQGAAVTAGPSAGPSAGLSPGPAGDAVGPAGRAGRSGLARAGRGSGLTETRPTDHVLPSRYGPSTATAVDNTVVRPDPRASGASAHTRASARAHRRRQKKRNMTLAVTALIALLVGLFFAMRTAHSPSYSSLPAPYDLSPLAQEYRLTQLSGMINTNWPRVDMLRPAIEKDA